MEVYDSLPPKMEQTTILALKTHHKVTEVQYPDCPKQEDGCSCGPFALANLAAIVFDQKLVVGLTGTASR
jgi:hypothetical protein